MSHGKNIRRAARVLVCLLIICLCATALATARMPQDRGVVTDDANVLGVKTASDIAKYASELEDETNVKLHVALVDFLDGMPVQDYADALFASWGLGDDDLLLVGAAGEDSFAAALGADVREKMSVGSISNLMHKASRFAECFQSQQYDAAFASFFTAFNTLVEKQYDERVDLDGLFEGAQAAATPEPKTDGSAAQSWVDFIASLRHSDESYQETTETRKRSGGSNGIGFGGWVVLAIIIGIVFGQSDPARRGRKQAGRDYRRYGCGCSPLGWVLSMIGAGVLIDNLRRRR